MNWDDDDIPTDSCFHLFLKVDGKKLMQQPEVVRITTVGKMEPFKTGKKGPPASGKVLTSFKPKAFYVSVVSRPTTERWQ